MDNGAITCANSHSCAGGQGFFSALLRRPMDAVYDCSQCNGMVVGNEDFRAKCCETCYDSREQWNSTGTFDGKDNMTCSASSQYELVSFTCRGCDNYKQRPNPKPKQRCHLAPSGAFVCDEEAMCNTSTLKCTPVSDSDQCKITPCGVCENDVLRADCCKTCLSATCNADVQKRGAHIC